MLEKKCGSALEISPTCRHWYWGPHFWGPCSCNVVRAKPTWDGMEPTQCDDNKGSCINLPIRRLSFELVVKCELPHRPGGRPFTQCKLTYSLKIYQIWNMVRRDHTMWGGGARLDQITSFTTGNKRTTFGSSRLISNREWVETR